MIFRQVMRTYLSLREITTVEILSLSWSVGLSIWTLAVVTLKLLFVPLSWMKHPDNKLYLYSRTKCGDDYEPTEEYFVCIKGGGEGKILGCSGST